MDYWDYTVSTNIGLIGDTTIFNDPTKYANCLSVVSRRTRREQRAIGACSIPGGNPLAYVINTNLNLGDTQTNGFDFSFNWNRAPPSTGGLLSAGAARTS